MTPAENANMTWSLKPNTELSYYLSPEIPGEVEVNSLVFPSKVVI